MANEIKKDGSTETINGKYYCFLMRWNSKPKYHEEIKIMENLIKHYSAKKPRILDFGCGTGKLVKYLKKNGYDALGVDLWPYSEKYLFQIKEKARLPFRKNCFDIIIFMHSIAHIKNIRHSIAECRRTLKKQGHIIIITPNPRFLMFYWILNRWPIRKIRKYKPDHTVVKHYSAKNLRALFPRKTFALYYTGKLPFCKETSRIFLNRSFKDTLRERIIFAVRL